MNPRRFGTVTLSLLALAMSPLYVVFADSGVESLEWQDCLRLARQNHPGLLSAREKVAQSKAALGSARSAYLPKITGNASAGVTKTEGIRTDRTVSTSWDRLVSQYLTEQASKSRKDISYSMGVSGKQMLFDGTKTIYQIRSAEKTLRESESLYQATAIEIRRNLRIAFVNLLKTQESLDILESIIVRRKKNLDLVRMRYRSGREHRGSLLNAEAGLAQAEYELRQAARNLLSNRRALLKEMGIDTARGVAVRGNFSDLRADRTRPDFGGLTDAHPSVRMALRRKEAAAMNVKAKIADFSPVFSATGSVAKSDDRFPPGVTSWSAGLEVTASLFQGGEKYYQLKNARAAERQSGADLKNMRDTVSASMEQKWVAWQNAVDLVGVQEKFLMAAEERSRIAEGQYSIGLILFDNWIIIEDDLARMKKSFLEARAAAHAAEAEWLQAKGVFGENER